MLLVLVILAISLGLTYSCNFTFLKQKPCPTGIAVIVAGVIGILSLVAGLVLVSEVFNSGISPKVIGPALAIGVFGSWGLLNRRKKGADIQPEAVPGKEVVGSDREQEHPPAAVAGTPGGISKRTRVTVAFAGVSTLLASVYPPWVVKPSKEYLDILKTIQESPENSVEWFFVWSDGDKYWDPISIAWDRFAVELVVIGVLASLLYVFMKDGKWPLK